MRLVIQRVTHASVTIEGALKSKIGSGLLILVGIEDADTDADINWLAQKVTNLRIFDELALHPAAAHSLRSHVCGVRSVFVPAHVAAKNQFCSFHAAHETLRGF